MGKGDNQRSNKEKKKPKKEKPKATDTTSSFVPKKDYSSTPKKGK